MTDTPTVAPSDAPSPSDSFAPSITDVPTGAPSVGSGQPSEVATDSTAPSLTSRPTETSTVSPSGGSPSRSPTSAPSRSSDTCVALEGGKTQKCLPITTASGVRVGGACIHIINEPFAVAIDFSTSPGWALVEQIMWLGRQVRSVPKTEDGGLDHRMFPYLSRNNTGASEWRALISIKCQRISSKSYLQHGVSEVAVWRQRPNGTLFGARTAASIVENLEQVKGINGWFSFFSFQVDCKCNGKPSQQPIPGPTLLPSSPSTSNAPSAFRSSCPTRITAMGKRVKKVCKHLITRMGIQVGEVCVEESSESAEIDVSFTAAPYWTFVSHHMWIGDFVADVPQGNDGQLSYESFPFYFCNSTGSTTWKTTLPSPCKQPRRKHHPFSIVIRSDAAQIYTLSGDVIPGTQESIFVDDHRQGAEDNWYGWFDFVVECGCELPPSLAPTKPSHPISPPSSVGGNIPGHVQDKACIQGGNADKEMYGQECHPLLLNTTREIVGNICVEIEDRPSSTQVVKITFTASDNWAFVKNEMWIDSDIRRIPKKKDGAPDAKNFPFFWYNLTGAKDWVARASLKCHKNPGSKYDLTAIVQSSVVPSDKNATLDSGFPVTAFGIEHEGSRGLEYGWLDFSVNCRCPKQVPVAAPTLPPSHSENVCLLESHQEETPCRELKTPQGVPVGSACAEQQPGSEMFDFEFRAEEHWSFLSHQVWVGFNLSHLPLNASGLPAYDGFTDSWIDSNGASTWAGEAAVSCLDGQLGIQKLYFASYSTAAQRYMNGTIVRNSDVEVLSHASNSTQPHDLPFVEVNCGNGGPRGESCDKFSVHLQDAHCGRRRIPLQGPCLQKPAGAIELSLKRTPAISITVQFESASPAHSFISTNLWLGPDFSLMPALPEDGMPDLASFPFFSSRNTGQNNTVFEQRLSLDCDNQEAMRFYGVAHAVSQEFLPTGRPVDGTQVASYGYVHDGYSRKNWFGYFDFSVECICEADREAVPFN